MRICIIIRLLYMPNFTKKLKKILYKEIHIKADKANAVALALITFFSFNFPQHSIIVHAEPINSEVTISSDKSQNVEEYSLTPNTSSEVIPEEKPIKTVFVYASAYNSIPNQTDSDPCTTANGHNLCESGVEDTIAANFLPFGTKVKIKGYPELEGKTFIVRDRMNKRYGSDHIDIWMKSYKDAREFGRRYLKIEIYEVKEDQIVKK